MHLTRLENISRKALLWDLKSPFTCLMFSFLISIKGPLIRTCVIPSIQYLSFRHVYCIYIQLFVNVEKSDLEEEMKLEMKASS